MAKHNEIGQIGEKIAQEYLDTLGYVTLDLNWRWGKGEIDIITKDDESIVFVEVKTRMNNIFGYPEQSVNQKKQKLMIELAGEYLYRIQHAGEFRFDIIAITLDKKEVKHFKDAFFPAW